MADRTKADRMRRYRERKRRGLTCVTVRLSKLEIDRLVRIHYLEASQCQNRRAIQEAAEAFVSDAFEGSASSG
jgi:hypothetical protein